MNRQIIATQKPLWPARIYDARNHTIALETALSGELVLRGHDGALRDLASVHGTYWAMQETDRAIQLVAATLLPVVTGPVSTNLF